MKTVFINIQIDDVKMAELEEIEDAINKAITKHKRRNVSISINDTFGQPLPEKP